MAPSRAASRWMYPTVVGLGLAAAKPVVAWVADGNEDLSSPLGVALTLHIAIQALTFGLLLPLASVLGISKPLQDPQSPSPPPALARLHLLLQVLAALLAVAGSLLGKFHGGRRFRKTAHAQLSSFVLAYVLLLAGLGVYLAQRREPEEEEKGSQVVRGLHKWLERLLPILCWAQIMLGITASLGFCFNDPPPADHLGQCLAHFSMGSAFVIAGFLEMLVARTGKRWLERRNASIEWWDSAVIAGWGLVNTFTEHGVFFSAGPRWSHKDQQHTTMGIYWLVGGLLGLWLSRGGKRNIIPGVVIATTGWAFGSHEQSLEYSTSVHRIFGTTLMLAGVARVLEVSFLSSAQPASGLRMHPWEHIMPLLLTISGVCFMTANEEQLHWVIDAGVPSATYACWQYALACGLYLYGNLMIGLCIYVSGVRSADGEEEELDAEVPKTRVQGRRGLDSDAVGYESEENCNSRHQNEAHAQGSLGCGL